MATAPCTFSRHRPHHVSLWLKVLVAAPYSCTSSRTGAMEPDHRRARDGLGYLRASVISGSFGA